MTVMLMMPTINTAASRGVRNPQIETPAARIITNSLLRLTFQKVTIAAIIIMKGNTISNVRGILEKAIFMTKIISTSGRSAVRRSSSMISNIRITPVTISSTAMKLIRICLIRYRPKIEVGFIFYVSTIKKPGSAYSYSAYFASKVYSAFISSASLTSASTTVLRPFN